MAFALDNAIEEGDTEIVRQFLEVQPDLTRWGSNDTFLDTACRNGNEEILKMLIEHGADVNLYCDGCNPLMTASDYGKVDCVKILLNHGAKINDQNDKGFTCLHVAVNATQTEVMKILLNKGADTTMTDKEGNTPLHIAVKSIISLLIALRQIDIDNGHENTNNPIPDDFADMVRLLVQAGADHNVRNNEGKSAMDIAMDNNCIDILSLLQIGYLTKASI